MDVYEGFVASVHGTVDGLENALVLFLAHEFIYNVNLLKILLLSNEFNHFNLVLLHELEGALYRPIKPLELALLNKLFAVCDFCGVHDLGIRRVELAVENVFQNGVIEDARLLHYEGNFLA